MASGLPKARQIQQPCRLARSLAFACLHLCPFADLGFPWLRFAPWRRDEIVCRMAVPPIAVCPRRRRADARATPPAPGPGARRASRGAAPPSGSPPGMRKAPTVSDGGP